MKRDGQNISIWQQDMPDFKSINDSFPTDADVVIIGGGITGISTALNLQLAGKSCVVIESQHIGFGTSGGTTAHLNTLMDTSYFQLKSNFGEENAQKVCNVVSSALQMIEENTIDFDIECGFDPKTAYIFSQNKQQSDELEKIIESTNEVGLKMEYCDTIPVNIPFEKAAKLINQGQIHATKYLYGIAEAFENKGGRIMQNCRALEITTENDETFVVTSIGKIKTKFVVYATHIPPGVNILHFCCAPYRSYVLAVKLKDNAYPDALVYDMTNPYHYYRTQELDGELYLIAGGEDHKTGHEENAAHCFTKLESTVRKHFNVDSIAFQWSSQYFEPADGLPYIGHLPGNPKNVLVATGFGGNGIIYGTVSSIILSDMITKGSSEYEELFNPARVKPVAGFEKFVKEAADVVGVFIGERINITEIKEFADLAKGEAKVVDYEGTSIAMYKDEVGKLYAVNPSCPHIKCVVCWNNTEKSWDCPCHGSRFSYTGELLTGPSRKDLTVIDLKEIIE